MAKKLSAFGAAYAKNRAAGKKNFTFEGKVYSTQSKEEKNRDIKAPSSGYDMPMAPTRYDKNAYSQGDMDKAYDANEGSKQGVPRFATFEKGSSRPQAYDPGGGTKRGNVTTFQPTDEFRKESAKTTGKFAPRPRIKVDM